jgi:hypothetical protein
MGLIGYKAWTRRGHCLNSIITHPLILAPYPVQPSIYQHSWQNLKHENYLTCFLSTDPLTTRMTVNGG